MCYHKIGLYAQIISTPQGLTISVVERVYVITLEGKASLHFDLLQLTYLNSNFNTINEHLCDLHLLNKRENCHFNPILCNNQNLCLELDGRTFKMDYC
jgi:hypothetical protein